MPEPSNRDYRMACEQEQDRHRQQELANARMGANSTVANGLLIGAGLTLVIGLVMAFMFLHPRTAPESPLQIQEAPVE